MIDTKPLWAKSGTYTMSEISITLIFNNLHKTLLRNNVDTKRRYLPPICLTFWQSAPSPILYSIYIHLQHSRNTCNFAVDNSNLNDNEKKNLSPATIHTDGYSHNVCHNTSK